MKKILGLGVLGLALVVGGVLVGAGFYGVSRYNTLVDADLAVKNAWAQVENQMQRRLDLIPNLVETIKGYSIHETSMYTQIADARARYMAAAGGGLSGRVAAANELNYRVGLCRSYMVENYPQVKADRQYTALMDELTGTENRMAVERKRFNDAVAAYNGHVRRFPGALVAKLTGFEEMESFTASVEARTAPKVKF